MVSRPRNCTTARRHEKDAKQAFLKVELGSTAIQAGIKTSNDRSSMSRVSDSTVVNLAPLRQWKLDRLLTRRLLRGLFIRVCWVTLEIGDLIVLVFVLGLEDIDLDEDTQPQCSNCLYCSWVQGVELSRDRCGYADVVLETVVWSTHLSFSLSTYLILSLTLWVWRLTALIWRRHLGCGNEFGLVGSRWASFLDLCGLKGELVVAYSRWEMLKA